MSRWAVGFQTFPTSPYRYATEARMFPRSENDTSTFRLTPSAEWWIRDTGRKSCWATGLEYRGARAPTGPTDTSSAVSRYPPDIAFRLSTPMKASVQPGPAVAY